jgi:hypothetical protein
MKLRKVLEKEGLSPEEIEKRVEKAEKVLK